MKDLGDEGKEREDKEQVSAWLHNKLAGWRPDVGGERKASRALDIKEVLNPVCLVFNVITYKI